MLEASVSERAVFEVAALEGTWLASADVERAGGERIELEETGTGLV